jgi:hypothetical protein
MDKGQVRATFDGAPSIWSTARRPSDRHRSAGQCPLLEPEDPYLYDVYTILTVDGKTVDVNKVVTGFRKTEFKGGAGTGGVYLNDKFVYLKGFAQRSSNEWAGVGGAIPIGCTISPPRCFATATAITCAGCTWRRSAWMPKRSTASASSDLPRRRQGRGRARDANGSSAWRSCATP